MGRSKNIPNHQAEKCSLRKLIGSPLSFSCVNLHVHPARSIYYDHKPRQFTPVRCANLHLNININIYIYINLHIITCLYIICDNHTLKYPSNSYNHATSAFHIVFNSDGFTPLILILHISQSAPTCAKHCRFTHPCLAKPHFNR